MNLLRNILFIFSFCCLPTDLLAQYIQVNDTYTAQQLVENVLIDSPCANVSNFSISGDTFSVGEQSYGYFTGGSSSFPFSSGIVLSTSRAKRTEGPNDTLIDEGQTSWLGDSDLNQALGISNTFNATVLEFDFIPLTSNISFDYIFASEEYQGTAPCRYSDGFAFLLKEVGTSNPYQNLALIPGTSTPVLVTSVHPDISGNCPAINEAYFGGFNDSTAPINLNGQTVVLTAKSAVNPGVTYHIKLVIADHENIRYDSAIFLGGGSFNVGTDLGMDQLIATNNPICDGETYLLDATEPGSNSYKWFRNGVLISGANNPTYTVNSSGIYSVEITLGSTTCVAKGKITIEYTPLPTLTDSTIVQCDENHDGTTQFNLTKVDNIIKNGDASLGLVTYYENLVDAQNQTTLNAIANPTSYQSTPKTIYASVSNAFGCSNTAEVSLQISNNTVSAYKDYESCDLDGDKDGFYGFPLIDIDPIVLNGLPSGLVVTYFLTYEDALLGNNILSGTYTNTIRYVGSLYAKIINGSDCYGILLVRLFVNKNEPDNFEDEPVFLCDAIPQTLSVASTFVTYTWSNGDADFTTDVTTPGDYSVTVTDANTCEATKKFIVSQSGIPTITVVAVNDFQGDQNSVFIHASGNGIFEYSLDGVNFQSSPNFTAVLPGKYTVEVRDINGCGSDFYTVYVLNYPTYFTPNDDGYHDIWSIENLDTHSKSNVTIFDRYGKYLYRFNANQKGWDGTLNALKLPSDDYWFSIELENNKLVKGHFALKR